MEVRADPSRVQRRTYKIHTWRVVNITSVVGVMKMGNIVPRVGLEPTSLAFRGQCAVITPCSLPAVTTIPMLTCVRSSLPQSLVLTTTLGYSKD